MGICKISHSSARLYRSKYFIIPSVVYLSVELCIQGGLISYKQSDMSFLKERSGAGLNKMYI